MSIWDEMTVTSIDSVIIVPSAEGRQVNINSRKQYALSFCFDDGQITYSMNGEKYVSNKSTAILLPLGATYSLHGDRTGSFPLINFYTTESFAQVTHKVCRLHSIDSYSTDFNTMYSLWNSNGSRAEMMSVFYRILSRLSREEQARHPTVNRAVEYIGNNIFSPSLSVSNIANKAGVSEVYLRKLFRDTYGTSPKQYILEKRISHAKKLLGERACSVTDISALCGFDSVYHFCRIFKLYTGKTPSEYQRSGN